MDSATAGAAACDQLSTSLRKWRATNKLTALRLEEDGSSMEPAVRRSAFGSTESGSLQELLAKSLLTAAVDDKCEEEQDSLLLVDSPDLAAFLLMGSQRTTRIVYSDSVAIRHVSDEEDDDEEATTTTSPPRRRSSSSFTRAQRLVPCSPPILIPQNSSMSWSNDTQTSSSGAGGGAIGGGSRDPLTPVVSDYSRTQQEAQLWDEYWHYKLSLEARESFENNTRENGDQQQQLAKAEVMARKAQSIASMTSTEDTTREDEWTTMSDEDEDCHVFAMDDL